MTEATSTHTTRPHEEETAHEASVRDAAANYGECDLHLRGFPTRAKIKELHHYWFDTGIPLVVELADTGAKGC